MIQDERELRTMSGDREGKAVQYDEAGPIACGVRWIGGNLHRRVAAAIVELSIKSQSAKPCVPELSILESGVLDDRYEAWVEKPEPLAKSDRRRERRPLGREIARRDVEPFAKVRRHIGVAREGDRAVFAAKSAEDGTRSTVGLDDEAADDDIGAGRDVALEPVRGARPRHVAAIAFLGDDPFQPVFGHHFEERLAVIVQVLGYGQDPRSKTRAEKTRAALSERPRDERPAVGVEKIERDEDRAAAALRGLGAEPPGEKVVARTTTRIADHDLAIEDGALRQAEIAQLGHGGQQVAAAAIGNAKPSRVPRHKRANAVPLQLKDVFG